MKTNQTIEVKATLAVSIEKAWNSYTQPQHIVNWNFASDDWTCPTAKNILKPGGKFIWRMEAKDGSMGFDFSGTYSKVLTHKEIEYLLDDDRKVEILFLQEKNKTTIRIFFQAESMNPIEMQKAGWQAILNNFKKYTESL